MKIAYLRKTCERNQDLPVEEKKSSSMVMNDIKTLLKMKNKGWLTMEKIVMKFGEMLGNKRLVQKMLG